ncbi:hypothetical protein PG989_013638 [Apiospora arundinis]
MVSGVSSDHKSNEVRGDEWGQQIDSVILADEKSRRNYAVKAEHCNLQEPEWSRDQSVILSMG